MLTLQLSGKDAEDWPVVSILTPLGTANLQITNIICVVLIDKASDHFEIPQSA